MENIAAIIEALILASETPLGLDKIYSVLEGTDKALFREALNNLIASYEQRAARGGIGTSGDCGLPPAHHQIGN